MVDAQSLAETGAAPPAKDLKTLLKEKLKPGGAIEQALNTPPEQRAGPPPAAAAEDKRITGQFQAAQEKVIQQAAAEEPVKSGT